MLVVLLKIVASKPGKWLVWEADAKTASRHHAGRSETRWGLNLIASRARSGARVTARRSRNSATEHRNTAGNEMNRAGWKPLLPVVMATPIREGEAGTTTTPGRTWEWDEVGMQSGEGGAKLPLQADWKLNTETAELQGNFYPMGGVMGQQRGAGARQLHRHVNEW